MKKLYLALLILFLGVDISIAQNGVKRYVLLEHFTNTNCSICANRNPTFFNLIDNYPNDVHHIAYHPPYPYVQCIFYQQNKEGNQARADYYNLEGTPDVFMLGAQPTSGGGLLGQSALEPELGQESPLEIIVEEEGNVFRTVDVEVKTWGDLPQGNYTLYVMVTEKLIEYNAPNGETEHHNVFRQSLPNDEGTTFTPAPLGESASYNFSFPIDFEWFEQEIYVLAFVQNDDTKEVINSGTKFDERPTSLSNTGKVQPLSFSPNPVQNELFISFDPSSAAKANATLKIFDVQGRIIQTEIVATATGQVAVDVSNLPSGVWIVQLESDNQLWNGKVVK